MSLNFNTNLLSLNISRTLNNHYDNMASATERLASGLRINDSGDDASGFAIREFMRSEMEILAQGKRNANDGISLLQTADGALSVIDEKLIRMKELAEQASTGTYDDIQRSMINDEYQAMASEITRISHATDFNGIKLLDGTLSAPHDGSVTTLAPGADSVSGALKIHFGSGNDAAEDYFFVQIAETTSSALGVGDQAGIDPNTYAGDAHTVETLEDILANHAGGNLSGAEVASLNAAWENDSSRYINKLTDEPFESLEDFMTAPLRDGGLNLTVSAEQLNGTAPITAAEAATMLTALNAAPTAAGAGTAAEGTFEDPVINITILSESYQAFETMIEDAVAGPLTLTNEQGILLADAFEEDKAAFLKSDGTQFANFAEFATTSIEFGGMGFSMSLDQVPAAAGGVAADGTPGVAGADAASPVSAAQLADMQTELDLEHLPFSLEPGNNIMTQDNAQQALAALDEAITIKDMNRGRIGGMQNRLENTIANLTIQIANTQTAESRISDMDVGTEMTEFMRQQILSQTAISMLTQANSLPQMALQLFQ